MKKSVVFSILLVAGVSIALAHSLYPSLNNSNASSSGQYLSAACQDYQARVQIGGVVRIASGKACRQADGSWRIYAASSVNHAQVKTYYPGSAGNYSGDCLRDKNRFRGLNDRKLQQRFNEIHGWKYHGKKQPRDRFHPPQVRPKPKDHQKVKQLQPLLVENSRQAW